VKRLTVRQSKAPPGRPYAATAFVIEKATENSRRNLRARNCESALISAERSYQFAVRIARRPTVCSGRLLRAARTGTGKVMRWRRAAIHRLPAQSFIAQLCFLQSHDPDSALSTFSNEKVLPNDPGAKGFEKR
jgi:hypothetical protein